MPYPEPDNVVWHDAIPAADPNSIQFYLNNLHHTLTKNLTLYSQKYNISVTNLILITTFLTILFPTLLYYRLKSKKKSKRTIINRLVAFCSKEETQFQAEDLKHLDTTAGTNLAKNVCFGCFEEKEDKVIASDEKDEELKDVTSKKNSETEKYYALPNFRDLAVKPTAKTLCVLSSSDCLVAKLSNLKNETGRENSMPIFDAKNGLAGCDDKNLEHVKFTVRPNTIFRVSNPHRYRKNALERILAHLRRRFMSISGEKRENSTNSTNNGNNNTNSEDMSPAIDECRNPCDVVFIDLRSKTEKKKDGEVDILPVGDSLFLGSSSEVELKILNFELMPSPFSLLENGTSLLFRTLTTFVTKGKAEAKQLATDELCVWMAGAGGLRALYCVFLEFHKKRICNINRGPR